MKKNSVSPKAYLERVRPMLGRLYTLALLITDNAVRAEEAVGEALQTVYEGQIPSSRQALREKLNRAVRTASRTPSAADALNGGDWFPPALPEGGPLYDRFCMLDHEQQRYIALLGAGFSAQKAAHISGLTAPVRESEYAAISALLLSDSASAPDLGAICRAFERDAAQTDRKPRRAVSPATVLLCLIGALICIALFWLMVILIDPGMSAADPEFLSILSRKPLC